MTKQYEELRRSLDLIDEYEDHEEYLETTARGFVNVNKNRETKTYELTEQDVWFISLFLDNEIESHKEHGMDMVVPVIEAIRHKFNS